METSAKSDKVVFGGYTEPQLIKMRAIIKQQEIIRKTEMELATVYPWDNNECRITLQEIEELYSTLKKAKTKLILLGVKDV
jgi:hypothetical protein